MPNPSGVLQVVAQEIFSSSATQKHRLGSICTTGDGRFYRYCKAGGVTLVVGNALQSRIEDVDHDIIAVRATAVGATSLLITTGSGGGALDANEYLDGYAAIDTTGGVGYFYSLAGHAAILASTNGELPLINGETVQVALDTSSKITLAKNPYDGVIQFPVTTATGTCVGGCVYPITNAQYGWIQSYGPGAALIAGTPGAGLPVTPIGAVAGALTVHSAELGAVATMMVTGRDTKVLPVFWRVL